jgi:hypothetical protein
MAVKIRLYRAFIKIHGHEDLVVLGPQKYMAMRLRLYKTLLRIYVRKHDSVAYRALIRIHRHEDVVVYRALRRIHGRKD